MSGASRQPMSRKSSQDRLAFLDQPAAPRLRNDFTEDQWKERGHHLGHTERVIMWDIGEWWALGVKHGFAKPAPNSDEWKALGWPAHQTCRDAAWVCSEFDVSRRRDNLPFNFHREVAGIENKGEADRLLDVAESDGLTIRELRNKVREVRRIASVGNLQFPVGRYGLLYVDPPWRYEHSLTDVRQIENKYPTMSVEEICELPVPEIAADNAMLFMWGTNPKLIEATQVLEAWGFEYLTNIVWVKDKMGMGYYGRGQHELLFIARRGVVPPPSEANRASSVVQAPRGAHSEKPEQFYELLETWYPTLPRIELFARQERAGWTPWGNQLLNAPAAAE